MISLYELRDFVFSARVDKLHSDVSNTVELLPLRPKRNYGSFVLVNYRSFVLVCAKVGTNPTGNDFWTAKVLIIVTQSGESFVRNLPSLAITILIDTI